MSRRPAFDAINALYPGVWNLAGTIPLLDQIIDKWEAARPGLKTGPKGIALIKEFEGLRLEAYPDPGTGGEPWTIGIGTTVYPDGRKVRPGDVITEAKAEEYLAHDLERFEEGVRKAIGTATQNQFDAMVSLAYNIGIGAFAKSTLAKLHRTGNYAGAAAEFARWNRAGGRVLAGLPRRRAAEAKLYRGGA